MVKYYKMKASDLNITYNNGMKSIDVDDITDTFESLE